MEAKQNAEVEQALKGAHPQDGVYAAAGADFEERCAKFNDTIVVFARKSIKTASNICQIEHTQVQLPDTVTSRPRTRRIETKARGGLLAARAEPGFSMMSFCRCFARRVER